MYVGVSLLLSRDTGCIACVCVCVGVLSSIFALVVFWFFGFLVFWCVCEKGVLHSFSEACECVMSDFASRIVLMDVLFMFSR